MRRLAFVVGITLLLGSFPLAAANHLTVGTYDGVGMAAEEAPTDEDRSVPGTTPGYELEENDPDADQEYAVGTTEDCHEYSSNVEDAPDEAATAAQAHGFCGMLIYHEDSTEIRHDSTPDQHLRDPIGTFDVMRAQTYFAFTPGTCQPFCEEIGGEQNPAFDAVWNGTHDALSGAGLTDDGETAYEEEGGGDGVGSSAVVHVTSPTNVLQNTVEPWEMNGWWWPAALSTFVAFVEDTGGDPIDDERLDEIVTTKVEDGVLDPNTEASICGYTPDFQFTTVDPDAAGLNCEFEFSFVGDESDGDLKFDGYENGCESPTYVCGGSNGPAWYSQGCVCLGLTDPEPPGFDNMPTPAMNDDGSPLAGPEGQTDYIRWHFVIAPHNSECAGAQEPGFSFTPDGGEDPYLAHDVDVWTTAASTSYHDAGSSGPEVLDYTDAVAESFTKEIGDRYENPSTLVGSVPLPAETGNVVRDTLLEPNLATTEPIALDDTSRQQEVIERNLEGFCEREVFSSESTATLDPWVDLLDSRAIGAQDVDVTGTYATDERVIRQIDLFLSDADGHDGTNRPGPSLYHTDGKVGMFSDKDDDGEYDQLEAGIKYNAQNPFDSGAYPMVWDVNLEENDDGDLVPDENHTLTEAAIDLGYGAQTGLVQAVYLNEPTAIRNPGAEATEDDIHPYPDGNNIFLMTSQGAGQLYEAGDNEITTKIDDLVADLQAYVTDNFDRDEPTVIWVDEELDLVSFTDQSSGPTGNFDSAVQFAHDCQTFDCSGDTIATMYAFELEDGTLKGSNVLPDFQPGDDLYDFGLGHHAWYDIDPFDNDPDRNEQRQEAPPNPRAGMLGEGFTSAMLD